jgi:hypothetical protein
MSESTSKEIGRPSILSDCIEPAKKYLMGGYIEVEDAIPSIAGLACYLGVARSAIYRWGKEEGEFKDILEGILSMQERKLLSGGLKGDFNPTIAKLILTKHGYSDRAEIDNTSSDGSMATKPTVIQLVPVEPEDNE